MSKNTPHVLFPKGISGLSTGGWLGVDVIKLKHPKPTHHPTSLPHRVQAEDGCAWLAQELPSLPRSAGITAFLSQCLIYSNALEFGPVFTKHFGSQHRALCAQGTKP